jgi:ankyrin repeat protein
MREGDAARPLLQALVAAGADPEIATAVGETPLGLALASDPAHARWLNWSGWRLPRRRLQHADLVGAAAAGDLDAVVRLLELDLPIDATDAQGATALIRAAGSGHAALVVHLLDAGADTQCVSRSGIHCLAAAVAARREAVVRTLLSHGVSVDLPIAGGGTALIIAAALGEPCTVEALLESGANPNAVDAAGVTPLQALAQHAFAGGDAAHVRTVLDRLLQAGARLDACNSDGQDALLVLLGARAQPGTQCDAERIRTLAEYLLQTGASVDTQDRRGVGILHACALHGLLGCARLLKAHGAPVDQLDAFGRTAADVAALLGYVDVAAELGMAHASRIPGVRQTLRRPARAPD